MSFTARVIATGELFWPTTDLGPDQDRFHDAYPPLEPLTFYRGHFFPETILDGSGVVRYRTVTSEVYRGDDLEIISGDLRLTKYGDENRR